MNKIYDQIIAQYEEYINYNKFVEEEKVRLKELDEKITKKAMEDNATADGKYVLSEELKDLMLDKIVFKDVYSKDAQLLFYNLYKLVEVYMNVPEVQILPKEITTLCEQYSFTAPKTIMVVDGKKLAERNKGDIEKIKKMHKESRLIERELQNFQETIKNQAQQ